MIVLKSRVRGIYERMEQNYVTGVGKDTVFKETSKGWFVYLEGLDPFFVGTTQPKSLNVGDKVTITIEKESK